MAEPRPTFQGCGDAAHLVEACVPLTADHLGRGGKGGLEGHLASRGGLSRAGDGTDLFSPQEQKLLISHGPRMRGRMTTNAPGSTLGPGREVPKMNSSSARQVGVHIPQELPGGDLSGQDCGVFGFGAEG